MRWTHNLETNLMLNDKVSFEIDFITGKETDNDRVPVDPVTLGTTVNLIGEDGAICNMQVSTDDSQFWTATL